jgi:type II secretory pathway predicted ATPase ExeA
MRDTRADLTLAGAGERTPFLTYEPYYGLREKPFSLSSDPRFLYKSRAHAAVYDDIRAGIRRREGLVVLTGDIGTGKTTLCRAVLSDLDRKTFSTFVPDPFASREDLLKMLLIDFGVMSVEDLKSGRLSGASRPELSYPLYEFLKTLVPLQAFAVLVIDEAQNLSLSLLEEIRILADLEGPEKLLQVVFIGQLELIPKLKDPKMRQLDQRVSVRSQLQPLDRDGVAGYIAHRLDVASSGSHRVKFSPEAIDVISRATRGNPRLINLVCDKSLHHGYYERTSTIEPMIVAQALAELGIRELTPPPEPMDEFHSEKSRRETEGPPAPESGDAGAVFASESEMALAESPRSPWRRVLAALIGVLAVAGLLGWRTYQSFAEPSAAVLAPARPAARAVERPAPAPPTASEVAQTDDLTAVSQAAGGFDVGVALFSGAGRAMRLETELEAAGYRASTWVVELEAGQMYEVRTGPYDTREAAQADADRIRALPGYADARVVPSMTAPQ